MIIPLTYRYSQTLEQCNGSAVSITAGGRLIEVMCMIFTRFKTQVLLEIIYKKVK